MPRLRHTIEQILAKLREAEVALSKGQPVAQVCRSLAITEQTYYRWRNEYGGLKVDQVKRLKELERENSRLKQAVAEVLPTALWQRCYVHFLRNALDHLPRSADPACLQELRWLYDRRDATEARTDLRAWLSRWQDKHPKLCEWVEANIEETFTFYRLPQAHHKHLKSTNMLERLNQEFKRRTHVVRIFTDEACCLRLLRALAVETHEEWIDGNRYLNMEPLRLLLRKPAPERKAA